MSDEKTFDPVLLRTYLAVVNGLSFTRAAERLGISQPAVSQHVRRLEQAAGRLLLRRDTRTVALTDNGEAMAGFARTILAAHDEAVAYFTGSAMAGRLRFGAADELALSELPTILREFRQLYPRINLELTVTQSGILQRRLLANHLDLIFINQHADSGQGQLVRRDQLVWVGHERVQVEPDRPVPVITYQAPSLSRSAAISSLEGDRPDLADHLQHPRDQRRAGRRPGRHRHLRAGPLAGAGRSADPDRSVRPAGPPGRGDGAAGQPAGGGGAGRGAQPGDRQPAAGAAAPCP